MNPLQIPMVYAGNGVWLRKTLMGALHKHYEHCVTSIRYPRNFVRSVDDFVKEFMDQEMSSPMERCNYWKSFLNPVARKKTLLLLGMCISDYCTSFANLTLFMLTPIVFHRVVEPISARDERQLAKERRATSFGC